MKPPYAVQRVLDHHPDLKTEYVMRRLKQSSFVSVDKRYMYFEVPKAACTQMKELLRTLEGAPPIKVFAGDAWETRRDMFIHSRSNVPLPSLVELDDKTQREVLEAPDFLRMTVIRNPYTRLASAWRNKILLCEPAGRDIYVRIKGRLPDLRNKSLVSFGEFVEYLADECDLRTCDCHWRRQADHTFFPALNFSLIARVERFGEGLRFFQHHLGLSQLPIADGRNISTVGAAPYTAEIADKVYSLYRPDFDLLGYDRNSWLASPVNGRAQSKTAGVPEQIFNDEIIERNLVIYNLHEERARLQVQLRHVSQLDVLFAIVNRVSAARTASRRLARGVRGWARRKFGPRRTVSGAA
ncbi:MAG TPA: sulfotransferase family 2 domain-containing protein [Nitrospirales bacterium]